MLTRLRGWVTAMRTAALTGTFEPVAIVNGGGAVCGKMLYWVTARRPGGAAWGRVNVTWAVAPELSVTVEPTVRAATWAGVTLCVPACELRRAGSGCKPVSY